MGNSISILAAMGGGLLSFLSPCVFPLVPAYFAVMAGQEILDDKSVRFHLPLFLHSLTFVAGFSIVFAALGAAAGWAGFNITSQLLTQRIAGGLMIAFGLFMLLALKVPLLNYQKRFSPLKSVRVGYLRTFIIGLVFAFAWTPCVGPILGGILALALDTSTVWQGVYLLLFYSLGLGIPFLILGAAFGLVLPMMKRIQKYAGVIHIAGAILLITAGILTLTTSLF